MKRLIYLKVIILWGGGDISITKEQNTGQISNQVLHFEQKILFCILTIKEGSRHRRKGKGRRFCLGDEFNQFLAAVAVLPTGQF